MKLLLLLVSLVGLVYGINTAAVATFADANWNCVTAACTSRVTAGTFQDNYECAEFVSRSIAAGGAFPGLSDTSAQSSFGSYDLSGTTYDLLWVSSGEGGPLGLEDALKAMGWTNVGTDCSTSIKAGYVAIVNGADGPRSHTFVGVGENLGDAHNNAQYHVDGCFYGTPNAIYAPPGGTPTIQPAGCKEVYTVNTALNLRSAASTTASILAVMTAGSTVYDMTGKETAADGYNWRNINYNGKLGYAADTYLTAVAPCVTQQYYCVTASPNLNLRSGPCTTYSALTIIPKGDSVTSLSDTLTSGCGYSWRNVNFNGIVGYAANTYLEACTPLGEYQSVNGSIVWPLNPGACANASDASVVVVGFLSLVLLAVTMFF